MAFGARPFGTRTFGDGTGDSGYRTTPASQTITPGFIDDAQVFGPVSVAEPKAIAVGFIDGGVVFGPKAFPQTDATGAPITVTPLRTWLLDDDMSLIGELTQGWGRTFQDVLNDTGSGTVSLQNGDVLLPSALYGRRVRFDVDGIAAWCMRIEGKPKVAVAPGEEVDQATQLSGRSNAVDWEKAAVDPALGLGQTPVSDQRILGWQDPWYDDSAWGLAVATTTNIGQVGVDPALLPLPVQAPIGFPTEAASWIWDRNSAGPNVPQGLCYFRDSFTLAGAKQVQVWAACDDAFDLYINGVPVVSDPGWYRGQHQHQQLNLGAGTHYVAVRCENQNIYKAGLIAAVMEVATDGTLVTTPLWVTDTGTKVLGYPATVPGFTAGALLLRVLAEAQALGQLTGWTCSFTALYDSAGNPWPEVVDVVADIGLDLLSLLRQLAETYIDWAVAPAQLRLDAWAIGTRGATTTVTLAEGVNLLELSHTSEAAIVNDLTLRYDAGYTSVQDSASIATYGRQRATLRLEGVELADTAELIGTRLLGSLARPRSTSVASVEPAGLADRPYSGDWQVADWLTADDEDDTPDLVRVRSISVTEDELGLLTKVAELRDVLLENEDVLRRTLKRAALGLLGGRTDVASFTSAKPPAPMVELLEAIPPFTLPGVVYVTESGDYEFHSNERIVGVIVNAVAGTGTTTLRWKRNGTIFGSALSLAAAATRAADLTLNQQMVPYDRLRVSVTVAGGHSGVVVQFLGAR